MPNNVRLCFSLHGRKGRRGQQGRTGKKETNIFVGFYDSSVNQLETWSCAESPLLLLLLRRE